MRTLAALAGAAGLLVLLLVPARISTRIGADAPFDPKPGRVDHTADFDTMRTNLADYIWPTDGSMKVTSAFAEYRTTHFHGGIDISTNGHAGAKVFAVRDGYLYRIRISPVGYGKMLFVRHKDGFVSAYAHLQTFNPEINEIARQEQYRKGTYAIDLQLEPWKFRVSQGEVIAYSGNTGFGPPHLHFELWDENLNPVNPLLCTSYSIHDDIPPFIRRVIVTPLSSTSTVDDGTDPVYFSRFPRHKRTLFIPQTIRVHGLIGLGVDANDLSDGTWSRAGIHSLEFYLDDSLRFSMELNRMPAEDTKEIDLHYDLPAIVRGRGKFQKLYVDTGNSLPFYHHQQVGSGIVNTDNLREGKHEFRIVCKDINDNQTDLEGTLFANHTPVITIRDVSADRILLGGRNLSWIANCTVFGKRAFQSNWTQHTLPRDRFEIDSAGIELPVNTKPYDVIKVVAETEAGSESKPEFHFLKKPPGPARRVRIDTDIENDWVRFEVSTPGVFTEKPILTVHEGALLRTVDLQALDPARYAGVFIPSDTFAGERQVHVDAEVNGRPSSADDGLTIYAVPRDRAGTFDMADGEIRVTYDSGAVFRPLLMQLGSETGATTAVYSLQPDDVLLNGGIRFSVASPAAGDSSLGLYYRSSGGWVLVASHPDSGGKTFSATLSRRLGDLSVMKDDEPPTIGRLRVSPRGGKVFVAFAYHDNLAGVDPDALRMTIDGNLVIPEIDGEHHRVWYQSDERLPRGRHTLTITMSDRMRNSADWSRTFSVR